MGYFHESPKDPFELKLKTDFFEMLCGRLLLKKLNK